MSVIDSAIDRIRELILSGELAPGDRLPAEPELASLVGVSRNSLREAVRALAQAKVLDVRRGDGTYVTSLEPRLLLGGMAFVTDLLQERTLLEVFEVRRLLEPLPRGWPRCVSTTRPSRSCAPTSTGWRAPATSSSSWSWTSSSTAGSCMPRAMRRSSPSWTRSPAGRCGPGLAGNLRQERGRLDAGPACAHRRGSRQSQRRIRHRSFHRPRHGVRAVAAPRPGTRRRR